jgi:hypothetical protein
MQFFCHHFFGGITTPGITNYHKVSSGNHRMFFFLKLLPDMPDLIHAPESSFKHRDDYAHHPLHLF